MFGLGRHLESHKQRALELMRQQQYDQGRSSALPLVLVLLIPIIIDVVASWIAAEFTVWWVAPALIGAAVATAGIFVGAFWLLKPGWPHLCLVALSTLLFAVIVSLIPYLRPTVGSGFVTQHGILMFIVVLPAFSFDESALLCTFTGVVWILHTIDVAAGLTRLLESVAQILIVSIVAMWIRKLLMPREETFGRRQRSGRPGPEDSLNAMVDGLQRFAGAQSAQFDENELEFVSRLGAGAFGQVYKAKWHGKELAVKVVNLQPDMPDTVRQAQMKSFVNEVGALSVLRHPNITLFMGICVSDTRFMIVSELVLRGSLWDLLRQADQSLDWELRRTMATDAVHGMEYLHHHGVIHGDLKSSNLLVTTNYHVKVTDFSIAQWARRVDSEKKSSTDTSDAATAAAAAAATNSTASAVGAPGAGTPAAASNDAVFHMAVGSVPWTAPEVLRSAVREPKKADVYSFGVCLWELATAAVPYEAQGYDLTTVQYKVASEGLRPKAPDREAIVPPKWMEVIQSCWHDDPAQRPTFRELLTTLSSTAFVQAVSQTLTSTRARAVDSRGSRGGPGRTSRSRMEELRSKSSVGSDAAAALEDVELLGNGPRSAGPLRSRRSMSEHHAETPDGLDRRDSMQSGRVGVPLPRTTGLTSRASSVAVPISEVDDGEEDAKATPDFTTQPSGSQPRWELDPSLYEFLVDPVDVTFIEKIGSGSTGEVYHAVYMNGDVAVKTLAASADMLAVASRRLAAETAVIARLQHPNIVEFIGILLDPPLTCLVLEYMSLGTLSSVLRSSAFVMDWSLRVSLALDAARGMSYLHSQSPPIIHRDLKSLNLLLTDQWVCKLGDFGFARVKANNVTLTRVGTPAWVAPEVLTGGRYTEKIDVYSFGVVLWELLTRQFPYANEPDTVALMRKIVEQDKRPPLPPAPADNGVQQQFQELIVAAWDRDPNARPRFDMIVDFLTLIQSSLAQSPSVPPPPFMKLHPPT